MADICQDKMKYVLHLGGDLREQVFEVGTLLRIWYVDSEEKIISLALIYQKQFFFVRKCK